jgi:hypothetical protein
VREKIFNPFLLLLTRLTSGALVEIVQATIRPMPFGARRRALNS